MSGSAKVRSWLAKRGWSLPIFVVGLLMVLSAVCTTQDAATETTMVTLGGALVLIGPVLPRVKGTIKLPGGIEIPLDVFERSPEVQTAVKDALVRVATVSTKTTID